MESTLSWRLSALPRWVWPSATALGGVALVVLVHLRDPSVPHSYGVCPILALTGEFCPGCGALRAVHALTHGDLFAAVGLNVLVVAAIPVAGLVWLAWLARSVGWTTRRVRVPTWAPWALVATVTAFWLLRNLPWFEVLAP